ncbi:hypothetical protein, partial [Mesorhizobium sp. B2-4-16]|uniref:hypothetical protein n=1 Tax=Mesorhizobium sp. B2-4-16 TaxID=2589933 RepID=UPI001AEECE5C
MVLPIRLPEIGSRSGYQPRLAFAQGNGIEWATRPSLAGQPYTLAIGLNASRIVILWRSKEQGAKRRDA